MHKEYLLDTGSELGREQLHYLETLLDPPTTRFLETVEVQPGWRCLDLGAGAGSITRWLAERTGPDGTVVAVDLDTDHLVEQPGVEVWRHDINDGLPVEGPFDLVHARSLLMHLSRREEIFTTLVQALAPGGWLVIADGIDHPQHVLSAPSEADKVLFTRVMDIGMHVALRGAGVSWEWAHEVDGHMTAAGLVDIHSVEHAFTATGGTAGCLINRNYSIQTEPKLLEAGLTDEELRRYRELMCDPRFRAWSLLRYVFTGGRKPTRRLT
jgi:SAM-dependent methyltransferase